MSYSTTNCYRTEIDEYLDLICSKYVAIGVHFSQYFVDGKTATKEAANCAPRHPILTKRS